MALTAKTLTTARSANGLVQTRRGNGNIEPRYQFGAGNQTQTAVVEYDFNVDGPIPLVTVPAGLGTGVVLPSGSIVTATLLDVLVVGATATNYQATCMDDADLLAIAATSAQGRYTGAVGIVATAVNTVYATQAPNKVGVIHVANAAISTAGVITVATPFGLSAVVGQQVTVSGVTGVNAGIYNGTFTVTAVAATTITVALGRTPTAASVGVASVNVGDKEILLSCTGAANTAGKFVLYVDYVGGTVI
jgi:hypothetical protein